MKKALLVGINNYKQAPLNGCCNDVILMESLLKQRGFTINSLTDNDATKQNMLEELECLVTGCVAGDSLVFHYSGHGSQVPDNSGDENDGLDECILPIDFTWDNVILDDDLNRIFGKANGATIEVILDACHSGSGTRNVLLSTKATEFTSRFIQPPREIFTHVRNAFNVNVNPLMVNNIITWSGCRDDQTSADAYINGSYNGAFTFAFAQLITSSRKSTLEAVRKFMLNDFLQEPQLTCSNAQTKSAPFEHSQSLLRSLKFW